MATARVPFPYALAALAALAAPACKPDLGAPASLVTEARVLAVRAEPPEAAPLSGANVSYTALVVGPGGAIPGADVAWTYCLTPKPPAENNVVAAECLREVGTPVSARGEAVAAPVPSGGCTLFGPDAPAPEPGKPPRRPRDPDVTGGFYQPVRLDVAADGDSLQAIALERITCNLANASSDTVLDFRKRYHANRNPGLVRITAAVAGAAPVPLWAAGAAEPAPTVPPGAAVVLEAEWAADAAESFPVFDLTARTIVDHREALRASWFTSAGALEHERTGRGEDDPATTTDNGWTAPVEPGTAHLWLVLRDSRGGVDFAGFDVVVAR